DAELLRDYVTSGSDRAFAERVDRLREFFSKRGVAVGASGLATVLTANAVPAAPIGLSAVISTGAALTGTAVSTSTAIAATRTIAKEELQTGNIKVLSQKIVSSDEAVLTVSRQWDQSGKGIAVPLTLRN